MMRVSGVEREKQSRSSLQDASDRVNKRGETVEEKIRKLDFELSRCKDQMKKTRPGPAQDAIKARAMTLLKHKRIYEGQLDVLHSQTFNLDQVASAADNKNDSKKTVLASIRPLEKALVVKDKFQGKALSVAYLEPAVDLMRGRGWIVDTSESKSFREFTLVIVMPAMKFSNSVLQGMKKFLRSMI